MVMDCTSELSTMGRVVNSADRDVPGKRHLSKKKNDGVRNPLHVATLNLKRRNSSRNHQNGRGNFESVSLNMIGEASMFKVHNILCCQCGTPTQSNAANMCEKCLHSEVEITEGLQKHATIMHCPQCESYLLPPRTWIKTQLHSGEFLRICLKRLNLKRVALLSAAFVRTEPHSEKIKVMVKVKKEVHGETLVQPYIVEYSLFDLICDSCSKVQANPDQWVAAVQLRQNVAHRRTFFYLEQLILRHDAAVGAIRIKQMEGGIDFFFANRRHTLKFMQFVRNVLPTKNACKAKSVVSHQQKSINHDYRYTYTLEICRICREDLIFLPSNLSSSFGHFGPLVLCTKVTSNIVLLDPFTLRRISMNADKYWSSPFKSLFSCNELVEYVVLDVESIDNEVRILGLTYALAEVCVARVSDLGKNDQRFTARTHIGHLLKPGDYALGYDLYARNISDDIELHKYKSLPDVILIKKSYQKKRQKRHGKPRPWKLKSMNMEVDKSCRKLEEKVTTEYEKFLQDLEENPDMRFNISLYRNKECDPSELSKDSEDVPSVPLEELLADLAISDRV